jgi:hypothetical protein
LKVRTDTTARATEIFDEALEKGTTFGMAAMPGRYDSAALSKDRIPRSSIDTGGGVRLS